MAANATLRLLRIPLIILALVGVGVGGWFAVAQGMATSTEDQAAQEPATQTTDIAVEVVHPLSGGIIKKSIQPGTLEPFESEAVFAKVSGFLIEQNVDIGDRVTAGQVLARIAVPENVKTVKRDEASLENAKAVVRQMEAHLVAAHAESKAAEASVHFCKVLVRAKTAYRQYREKQLARFKGLAKERAIEPKVVDEQEDFYLSALEGENAANEGVNKAIAEETAAKAKITQAQADLEEAKSKVDVARAILEKAQVFLDYSTIRSQYNGVVTRRSFHLGDFIKAADQGGIVPMLAVERTDVMRVVVQVPDRDVPFVTATSTASIKIDALPGLLLNKRGNKPLTVSRWANAEDPTTRTMRTEIDVINPVDKDHPNGILTHNMYGQVTLILGNGAPNALRIPSSALVGKAEDGSGFVRIVREGKIHVDPVRYAADNGVHVEIVAGLTTDDRVVTRATGTLEEGTPVVVHEEKPRR